MDKLLLPPPLASDERFSILANIAAERFAQIDLTALLVYLVDIVDASALPSLAGQFHVQGLEGWLFAVNEQEKRELIKQAIELHKYKGTPWAVRRVLEILSLPGTISEWFEYGGKAYFFKVEIELINQGMDENLFNNLVDLIHEYKNVRSKLEALIVWIINQSAIPVIGSALYGGEITTVLPFQVLEVQQTKPIYFGTGQWSLEITSIYPE
ncbi:phage tail protein I [Salmonella enterica subsp. enterica serovar Tennessee]|uniref:Phage tail protein I n=2 Tax=Salmonella enterica I TaxID=59201 RepID=A0A3G3E3Z3_SALET|nr:phage tail protein I [Salmonella enterica]EAA4269714.1 phage tail protein I [Salmonella enterica subsp. enterica serovar Altona]EAB6712140.1 phage tail protein I [Salmonella enterica subsp. enterica serovar Tokoin]EBS4998905.1 phage tail protein I [Salmonella enterica subsp. enterica serovar Havana]EBW2073963.1 phage tail protein I [Salmonella enterica subsp. enterica serovar Krefeld]EBY3146724.1 phage tail protein I [Salmonella enterica subsp. enterica serovar Morehead]EDA3959288.1 phage 